MPILNNLAISEGRRDEVPNQELARELMKNRDIAGITEIAANLQNKNVDNVKKAIHEKSHEYTKNTFSPSPDTRKVVSQESKSVQSVPKIRCLLSPSNPY